MEFEFVLFSPMLVWSIPLGLCGQCDTNIQQVAQEEEEEEEGYTPHIDTWYNARVWVDFFDGLLT